VLIRHDLLGNSIEEAPLHLDGGLQPADYIRQIEEHHVEPRCTTVSRT
jgi:hypothetical protein